MLGGMDRLFLYFGNAVDIPDHGEEQQTAAKPLMNAIWNQLPKTAFDEVSKVDEWDSYGWYFDVRVGKVSITTMLQGSDQWLVLSIVNRSLMDRLMGRKYDAEAERARSAILEAIRSAQGNPNLRWMTEAEFNAKAA
jgi:hypothetical protein